MEDKRERPVTTNIRGERIQGLKVAFLTDEYIVTSPNCGRRVSIPARQEQNTERSLIQWDQLKPEQLRLTNWFYFGYLHLAFVQEHFKFEGPLFARLREPPNWYTFEHTSAGYSLHKDVQGSWSRLENALINFKELLKPRTWETGHSEFISAPLPQQFGYQRTFSTFAKLRRAVTLSRNAFLPIMAEISYEYILKVDKILTEEIPLLRDVPYAIRRSNFAVRDVETAGVSPSWVQLALQSELMDLSIPRVGMLFLADQKARGSHRIDFLLRNNIPVYIAWRRADIASPFHVTMKLFRPTDQLLEDYYQEQLTSHIAASPSAPSQHDIDIADDIPNIKRHEEQPPPAPDDDIPNIERHEEQPPPALADDIPNIERHEEQPPLASASRNIVVSVSEAEHSSVYLPEPDAGSGQLSGESRDAFFERRAKENATLEAQETVEMRADRKRREIDAARFIIPSSRRMRGRTVWEWYMDDGYEMRRKVNAKDLKEVWKDYTDTQKRYDPFRQEWDLCLAFDPSFVPKPITAEYPDDRDNGNDDNEPPWETLGMTAEELRAHIKQNSVNLSNDIVMALGLSETEIADPVTIDMEIIRDPEAANCVELQQQTAALLKNHFGYIDQRQTGVLDEKVWQNAQAIVCDMSSDDADLKVSKVRAASFITKLADGECPEPSTWDITSGALAGVERNFWVEFVECEDKALYWIRTARQVGWELMVPTAAAVLEIWRTCPCGTIVQMARVLLQNGYAFRTPSFIKPKHSAVQRKREMSLGFRAHGYVPDISDYAVYRSLRSDLLLAPRGRAALLHGGLLARIARDEINFQVCLLGPSEEAESREYRSQHGIDVLWDDVLGTEELDLICGKYFISTDEGSNTSDQSWWPKSNIWETSGHNLGFWTPAAEEWYKRRQQQLSTGDVRTKIQTAKKWRGSVKFNNKSGKLRRFYEVKAIDFVTNIVDEDLKRAG